MKFHAVFFQELFKCLENIKQGDKKMCNINVVIRLDKKEDSRVKEAINMMSAISFQNNGDGNGFFDLKTKKIHKRQNKCFFEHDSWGVISHERLATSGYTKENVQPIKKNKLTIIHNGVLYARGDVKLSDTHEFLLDIEHEVNKGKSLIKAIQTETEFENGYYSIFLYNEKDDKLLYFKDELAKFYFIRTKNWFIGSTEKYNVEVAKEFLKVHKKILIPEDYVIFNVLDSMKIEGKIKFKGEYQSYSHAGWNAHPYQNGQYITDDYGTREYRHYYPTKDKYNTEVDEESQIMELEKLFPKNKEEGLEQVEEEE